MKYELYSPTQSMIDAISFPWIQSWSRLHCFQVIWWIVI